MGNLSHLGTTPVASASMLRAALVAAAGLSSSLSGQNGTTLFGNAPRFGSALASSGNRLLVGAPARPASPGSVTLFVAGKRQHTFKPSSGSTAHFGGAVAFLTDIDGDGVKDYAIGGDGFVDVFSSKNHGRLLAIKGHRYFGFTIAGLGDVDKDGTPDLLIGSPFEGTNYQGAAHIYSGKSGKVLRTHRGRIDRVGLGFTVSRTGDLDQDRVDDYVIGCPGVNTIDVFSSRTGKLIRSIKSPYKFIGHSLVTDKDIDGDGVADIIAGAPLHETSPSSQGVVVVYSGKTGGTVLTLRSKTRSWFGFAVAATDIDGDGSRDVIVGDPYLGGFYGRVTAFSKSGTELRSNSGLGPGSGFGTTLAIAPKNQIAVGSPTAGLGQVHIGDLLRPYDWSAPKVAIVTADKKSFGRSCGPQPAVTIDATPPRGGTHLTLEVRNLKPPTSGIIAFGSSRQSWQGVRLPFDLKTLGFTGCSMLVSLDVLLPFSEFYRNKYALTRRVPYWLGTRMYVQAWVIEPKANAGGVITTNALELEIGR